MLHLLRALPVTVCLALASPVAAQDAPAWNFSTSGSGAGISFGVPKTDDVRFVLNCDNKKRQVDVTVFEHIENVKVGRPVTIELSAGPEKVRLNGRTTEEEPNVIFGRAKKVKAAPVLAVFRAPGEMTATMGGTTTKYPEEGRAAAVAKFEKDCKVK